MAVGTRPVFASIHPGPARPVDPRIAAAVRLVERTLGTKVFCLIHSQSNSFDTDTISPSLLKGLMGDLSSLPRDKPIAVLLHSPGGDAHTAFRIARTLIRHCGGYDVVVPCWAKRAATLVRACGQRVRFI